jgi:hypothetical protein
MSNSSYLIALVKRKIVELGDAEAAIFFGVSKALIQQWRTGSKPPSLAAVEKVFNAPEEGVPGGKAEWEGRKVTILQPFYKSVHPTTHFAILGLLDRTKMGAIMRFNDAYISHSRNTLAKMFLDTGVEWSFWIDDDMVIPWGNAAWFNQYTGMNLPEKFAGKHTLDALMKHEKSVVGALYFGRNAAGKALYYEAMLPTPEGQRENAMAHEAPRDELRPVRWAGTGALLVHRQVYLDIQTRFPHLAPQHPSEPWHFFSNTDDAAVARLKSLYESLGQAEAEVKAGGMSLEKMTTFLKDLRRQISEAQSESIRNSRLQQGEDQTFGIRAGVAGHQTYVDLGVVCGHIGAICYGPHNTRGR